MGPREKKKDPSPRKQMSIEGFLKPAAITPQKRPREEESGAEKQSPSKKSKDMRTGKKATSVTTGGDPVTILNNNNNNNNNNKEKVGSKKSPDEAKKKDKKSSDISASKTIFKKEKTLSPSKVSDIIMKKEKMEKMDIGFTGVDEDEVATPHPLINIPESDQVIITPQASDPSLPSSEGVFIGPDLLSNAEEFRGEEPETHYLGEDDCASDIVDDDLLPSEEPVPELLPMCDAPMPPASVSGSEIDSRILTPSPSPLPQVPKKNFKCKVCDEWFPNRYFQRKHMLMEHEDQLYECRVCSYNSCDPEKLKSHIIKMHVAKKERTELVTIDEAQLDLDELITKQTPRKVIMEDGVALGRDPSSKMRFICAICDRIYTSKYSLERHVRCHTGEKPYTCDVCNFTTSYREHMQRHMTSVHLIVHSDEPKQKYVPKRQKKTEEKNVSTEDCDLVIDTGVDGHDESHDGSFESHSSDTTSSSSKRRRNILRKRFECAACGLRATHKTDLIEHIKEKHPNAHIESLENGDGSKVHLIVTASKKSSSSRRMVITCPNCFMIFHDTWKYKVHMRSHTGVKPFGCSLCEFRATSKMTIRDHVHRKHKDAPHPKILLRTVGIDGTVQHVELSFPQREFKCDVCDENFQDNYHMKQHKKKNHQESLPFSCLECSHREWARASIIIHCLQSHPDSDLEGLVLRNDKPFTVGPHKLPKCDVCDKVFSYQSQLYLHQRQHTGERTYVCDICNYRTNHKPALQKHIEKHLTGPESPNKTKRKKAPNQADGPINFVEVDGTTVNPSATTQTVSIKKEGDKKKNAKVKKESVKVKKEVEKSKKDNVRVKKEKEPGKDKVAKKGKDKVVTVAAAEEEEAVEK